MSSDQSAMPLADTLRRQLLWIGLAMTISCLLLIFSFAINLIDLTSDNLMKLEAEAIIHQHRHNPEHPLPRSPVQSAWHHWQDIPQSIQLLFEHKEIVPGKPLEAITQSASGSAEYVYLLHYQTANSESLYLVNRHSADELEAAFFNLLGTALTRSSGITLLILIPLFILIAWLIRRMLEPLKLLSLWSVQLNHQNRSDNQTGNNYSQTQTIDMHFPISELNQIADQLRQGINHVRAVNQREQAFLKHASHELRTPLAVIQASLDTLNLQTESNPPANRSVQRALKACQRMIQLSDTLLWLARESDKTIPRQPIDIKQLCHQLINDHRYLLANKSVEVQQQIHTDQLEIEAPLLSILMSNLIRNAFQHCSNGPVIIRIDKQSLHIINSVNDQNTGEPGFGLGLHLVQQICQKLGWSFDFQHKTINCWTSSPHHDITRAEVRIGWPGQSLSD